MVFKSLVFKIQSSVSNGLSFKHNQAKQNKSISSTITFLSYFRLCKTRKLKMSALVSSGLLVLVIITPMTRVNTRWSGQAQHRVRIISKMRDKHEENRDFVWCQMHIAGDTGYGRYHSNCADNTGYKNLQTAVSSYIAAEKYFNNLSKTILFRYSGCKEVQIWLLI